MTQKFFISTILLFITFPLLYVSAYEKSIHSSSSPQINYAGGEWPDWERQRWLKHMNVRISQASQSIIKEDIFCKAAIEKYIKILDENLHLGGAEFYRDEFNYCDRNRDNLLSRREILYCNYIATSLIENHLYRTLGEPDRYFPESHIFAMNITKLQIGTQKKTGLDFEQYYKLKIFIAMVMGRALYNEHDNYYDKRNHYVCSSEWHDVQNGMRSIFPGYNEDQSWYHFEEFDLNRSYALEEYELYFYWDVFWKRWFLSLGQADLSKKYNSDDRLRRRG